ncbi:uncharacterized protein ATNIH1004_006508 [Aspergillus tanneri]|uniref:Enoyl reductase (ER) domain-containing protein n=1 Tax=Aspergillus tanneri TaxID=1220188 RepID=A0A5M9MZI6_9EURO|nr:uncharacterized protein ATNIH1004_006508 [Aspergillus tanneri]KAA8647807.1 hypothetical protein ATNIH1004_006508 [Aspergillus tanneri]
MPCAFTTALYALIYIGRVERGQSVLIHSAVGAVCQKLGAQIYVTVGSEEKVYSFVSGIMTATNGRGVDYVLNSLSGELLHESWDCVAEFGTLLEIGKRDLIGNGKLSMNNFPGNKKLSRN